MSDVIIYLIESAVVMTFLYLAYKWLMAGSTFHAFNRTVLLLIYAMSWLLPALLPLMVSVDSPTVEVGFPLVAIGDIAPSGAVQESGFSIHWPSVVKWLYLCGAAVAAAFTLVGAVKLFRLIAGGEKERCEGYTLVINDKAPSPLSWARFVVVRPGDCDEDFDMVLAHELRHKRLWHWIDLMPAQLTAVLQWFSPAAWLMMRELKLVHEFQVDGAVDASRHVEYQMMLLKKTVGSSFPTIADSLNHSQIKTRITMMMTKKSKGIRRMTAMMLPAAGALALLVLSQPVVADTLESLSPAEKPAMTILNAGKVTKNSDNGQTSVAAEPYIVAEETLSGHAAVEPATMETEGEVAAMAESAAETADLNPAYFVDDILFTGSIQDISPEDIVAMNIVKNDPAYPQGKIMIYTRQGGKVPEKVVAVAEKIAEYKGGMQALLKFMNDNIKYPKDVQLEKTERVIVRFEICPDGSVRNARIMKGSSSPECDAEALRIVNLSSGNWIPAENDGKPVASKFTIPISFKSTK